MGRLKGKVALVTGGALGIGASACEIMAREGAAVAVTDVLVEEGRKLAQKISDEGGVAAFWPLDVADEAAVAQVTAQVVERFGKLDVLVNNAGISGSSKPTHELTAEEWDQVMNVNVRGVFFCTKHAIGPMRAAGGGSIINLSSIYGLVSAPDVPPYHASKGAVRLMSKTDALLYAKENIRVNSVHPGFIWTPMVEEFAGRGGGDVAEARAAIAARHPVNRVGEAEDIAWGIVYLASEEARFVTGSELVIDGGYTAQ